MKNGMCHATSGTKDFVLEHGDLFISFPNQIHGYTETSGKQDHWIFVASPDICPEFKQQFKNFIPSLPIIKNADKNPHIMHAFESILNVCASSEPYSPYSEVKVRGNMLILLNEIMSNIPLVKKVARSSDILTEIIHYCYNHYTDEISLNSLASALHVNPYYISHVFNDQLRVNFRDYINSLRINKACELIKANKHTITEIVYEVGYNSARTFDRCFMQIKGTTPKEYRKKYINK